MTQVQGIIQKSTDKTCKVKYEENFRPVGAWIPNADFELLKRLADLHKVRLSTYLRAIIADALLKAAKNLLVGDSVDVLTIGRHVICVPGRSQLYDRRQRYSAASGSSPYRMPCDVSRR